tara:strand:+ start:18 stop:239 length:222 start_codon:yes stop_codon:yes gene_type:complete
MSFKVIKLFNKIDTVHGHCGNCGEETILVAVVTDYYRCINCGSDTKQHVNGSIQYIKLTQEEQEWLKRNQPSE